MLTSVKEMVSNVSSNILLYLEQVIFLMRIAVYKFYKDNKIISIGCLVAVIVVFSYIYTKDDPELFAHAEDFFYLLFQLSIGFIVSFTFFILQVYIPHQKKIRLANKCILARIQDVVEQMRDILCEIGKIYISELNRNGLTENDCLIILRKINFNDKIDLINPLKLCLFDPDKDAHYSVREWLIKSVENIERDSDKLLIDYSLYIEPELMFLLDRICKSHIHYYLVKMNLKNSLPLSINKLEKDLYFTPYLRLMNELIAQEKLYR